jgi:two-component system, NtrC family, sensor kinase
VLRSIAFRLMSSYLVIIVVTSVVLSYVGVRIIQDRVVAEAQHRVAEALNAAREIYTNELRSVQQSVRIVGERLFVRDAIVSGRPGRVPALLVDVLRRERLDVLAVTDVAGKVLWRPSNPARVGDAEGADPLVRAVRARNQAVAATALFPDTRLRAEGPSLPDSARSLLVPTPHARARPEAIETVGMMLAAAAPVQDSAGRLIGVAYGGVLLNRRFALVDKIKQVVFEDALYRGEPIGAVTIFLDDVRIATNVRSTDGSRAVGTRVSADVYDEVVRQGRRWIGRAFVVNDWYIAAYEPIRDFDGRIVGMLYVGTLEAPYVDMQRRSSYVFLGITLAGAALTVGFSYVMSQRFSVPLRQLATATRRMAAGDLNAKVETSTTSEPSELAESFNAMAEALRVRDRKLHESARDRIMGSERLAIVGKLAADVAHEINNPLQGIVTFAHLLREKTPPGDPSRVWLDKIVDQAERCRVIIRGLLDFSRPRKPVTKPTSVNALIDECVALVENQAVFQNIEVVKRLGADLPDVVIDPSLIQQVFMNLIFNAAEAMPEGGRLTLATRYDAAAAAVDAEFKDTGHGIADAELDRVFEPFFTTKPEGKGTGLGLAICFGIVKEHRGTIAAESELGEGATFTVRLPIASAAEQAA